MFSFHLGREYKLSIAEIFNVFPEVNVLFCDENILIGDGITQEFILEKANFLGGTIKISNLQTINNEFEQNIDKLFQLNQCTGKFVYGVNVYGKNKQFNIKNLLNLTKTKIKQYGLNPRFINKDYSNLSSIQVIKESLISKKTDYNFIFTNNCNYFGYSIWVQNIYEYSNRDYGKKDRDMKIGMLPPKLAQIMLNLSGGNTIYDPFVGLGTILIESLYMNKNIIYGSDMNKNMIQATQNNLEDLKTKFTFKSHIFLQNSKYIQEVDILNKIDSIVTEGYLGEIMTQNNISIDRINKQNDKLEDIYLGFFEGLKNKGFKGNIVISFPFWEINKKYFYCENIYSLLNKYCIINDLIPKNFLYKTTKYGSLLYKRNNQLVGREIFCLQIKK